MAKKQNLYHNAISRYGADSQIIVAIEEMSELTKNLTKYLRYHNPKILKNIAEEMADVEITNEQLSLIFKNKKQVQEQKKYKLKRLKILLKEQKTCI